LITDPSVREAASCPHQRFLKKRSRIGFTCRRQGAARYDPVLTILDEFPSFGEMIRTVPDQILGDLDSIRPADEISW